MSQTFKNWCERFCPRIFDWCYKSCFWISESDAEVHVSVSRTDAKCLSQYHRLMLSTCDSESQTEPLVSLGQDVVYFLKWHSMYVLTYYLKSSVFYEWLISTRRKVGPTNTPVCFLSRESIPLPWRRKSLHVLSVVSTIFQLMATSCLQAFRDYPISYIRDWTASVDIQALHTPRKRI